MATIVILGAGIGGMSQACELKQHLGKEHRIVVINDSDRFEFTPSNPWVAVGWRTQQQITVDLPPLLAKHGIEFIGQAAARVLPGQNEVELADGEFVPTSATPAWYSCSAADPAAQHELSRERPVGAPGQGRLREIFHPQDKKRPDGAVL